MTLRIYSETEADALDAWVRAARKHLGHKVDASRVVRELLRQLPHDQRMSEMVIERLSGEEQHAP